MRASRQPRAHNEIGDDGVDQHAAEAGSRRSAASELRSEIRNTGSRRTSRQWLERVGRRDVEEAEQLHERAADQHEQRATAADATTRNSTAEISQRVQRSEAGRKLAPRPRIVA